MKKEETAVGYVGITRNKKIDEENIVQQIREQDEAAKTTYEKIMAQIRECKGKILESTNTIIGYSPEPSMDIVAHELKLIEHYQARIEELNQLIVATGVRRL